MRTYYFFFLFTISLPLSSLCNISGISVSSSTYCFGNINVLHKFYSSPWGTNPAFHLKKTYIGLSAGVFNSKLKLKDSFEGVDENLPHSGFTANSIWISLPITKKISLGFELVRDSSELPEIYNLYSEQKQTNINSTPYITYRSYSDESFSGLFGISLSLLKPLTLGLSAGIVNNLYEEKTSFLYVTGSLTETLETTVFRKEEYLFSSIIGILLNWNFLKAGFVFKIKDSLGNSDNLLYTKSTQNVFSYTSYFRDSSESKKKSPVSFEWDSGAGFRVGNLNFSFQGKLFYQQYIYLLFKHKESISYSIETDCSLDFTSLLSAGVSLFYISPRIKEPLSPKFYTLTQRMTGLSLFLFSKTSSSKYTYNLSLTGSITDGTFYSPGNPSGDVDGYLISFNLHLTFSPI